MRPTLQVIYIRRFSDCPMFLVSFFSIADWRRVDNMIFFLFGSIKIIDIAACGLLQPRFFLKIY